MSWIKNLRICRNIKTVLEMSLVNGMKWGLVLTIHLSYCFEFSLILAS